MEPRFGDSAYYVAIIDRRDDLHLRAVELTEQLQAANDFHIVTCDTMFIEVLAYFSNAGSHLRGRLSTSYAGRGRAPRTRSCR